MAKDDTEYGLGVGEQFGGKKGPGPKRAPDGDVTAAGARVGAAGRPMSEAEGLRELYALDPMVEDENPEEVEIGRQTGPAEEF